MEGKVKITGAQLLLALDYLAFITSIDGYAKEWRGAPLNDHEVVTAISKDGTRGFQTEVQAIEFVFELGFEVEPDMRPGPTTEAVRSWKAYFELAGWALMRDVLQENDHTLEKTLLGVERLLDPSRLTMERGIEHTEAFKRFLCYVAAEETHNRLCL